MAQAKKTTFQSFLLRSLLTWLIFIPVAFINGTIREMIFKPLTAELPAHMLSCLTGSAAFVLLACFMLKDIIIRVDNNKLWLVGAIWLIMTILFEFLFVHYIVGSSWETIFSDYNILKGRLWSLVLITIFLTPIFIKRFLTGHIHQNKITNIV